ncbi:MAG: Eco57I restriction-modification methylase domain-containing protein [Caldilineaceae bacterium]|nr:Eco57I restriction-modification methylase domain-containing protein [Caldilineaceae bacterium]MBP8121522.1 Eco57I restriction-modification methylase domain-containing protein [Caldilineaceae bacterium]MBP9074099.1 Eco57I restriction-modification methylase domain-containing protein [Caldilineaceae bacterium]
MADSISTTNDLQFTAADIGQLENADQVVHFFARLGYDVNDSLPVDHAALGLDTVDLRQQIHAIRRVGADPVDGDVIVYLLEARSVTVALTQQIARSFRERPESALLILTEGYEKLDFVLVERELAQSKRMGSSLRQVIRPRSLTVNRRNPGRVDLRVLQRFTFTEADGAYQWEKLRSAFTLAEWSEEYFNNRALFSDYYLTARLTDAKMTPEWGEDVSQIGREALRHLADARSRYSGQPKATVSAKLYEPLFTSLGFLAVAQAANPDALDQPDYLLYAPDDPATPIAAALTTVWNRNLDDMDESRDAETPDAIPGALVVNVLAATPAKWVIVTNGKLWRLYSTTASNKATNYYEIDLEEAVNAPDQITALKYWWLFFRRPAFQGFLDDLLQKSADYAKELGDRLKERVFTHIFPHFAAGFIADMRQRPGFSEKPGLSDQDLEKVFAATMTFLYRLIFILYAESLELLPVYESRGYGEASLYRLKKRLAQIAGTVEDIAPKKLPQQYATDTTEIYAELTKLFQAIADGEGKLNLPKYNGGLFSAEKPEGRFLAEHAIPDRFLALGLDRLCRDVDAKTLALAFIDFKSLGVRQLGSIYEGLLEFRVRIASEKLAVVKEKGKEVYLPAGKLGSKRAVTTLEPGEVYLENDKRERKATGSYYTPDYIVKYIVAHTVGPVLDRKFEALAPRLREAQKLFRQHKATVAARGNDQPAELFWQRESMKLLADNCLDIKVLDPAMGSGHFLVEAVDFISDRLINFLNGWSENPVWALLERTRQDILADMERQGVSIDKERLTRVALLKRSVLKRCIYGVDLNGMAVELAKVSLWLDAFTLGAPLSFLDHHLKWGNSLIGARIGEVRTALESKAVKQLGLFSQSKFAGVMLATDLMRRVSYLSDNTTEQLEASRTAYRSAADHLAPYKRVLDVYTSRWFGNEPSKKGTDDALEFLQRADVEAWLTDPEKGNCPPADYMDSPKIAETAQRAAAEKRFFHWELEFPEVFFAPSQPGGQDVQLREDGGFDAVVGNPPYVSFGLGRVAKLDSTDENYLRESYESAEYKVSVYGLFIEGALRRTKYEGTSGLILPDSYLTGMYFAQLRQLLLDHTIIQEIVLFKIDFWEGGVVGLPTILIFSPTLQVEHANDNLVHIASLERPKDLLFQQNTLAYSQQKFAKNKRARFILHVHEETAEIYDNLSEQSLYLRDIVSLHHGIRSKVGRDRIISPERKRDSWKPGIISSNEVHRYLLDPETNYILVDPELLFSGGWDATEIENPKLLIRRTGDNIIATVDYQGFYHTNALIYGTPTNNTIELRYLLTVLNSRLIDWYYRTISMKSGRVFPQVEIDTINTLPIAPINFTTPAAQREQLMRAAIGTYDLDDIAGVVQRVLAALAVGQSDVVHDLLAFLAEQMIDLNKQKQAEVKRFLGWLETRLVIRPHKGTGGIDSLPGKTIIQGYLGDYQKGEAETAWADFYYRLHENRRRFGVQLDTVKGEIQTEYETSLAVLLPIKQQLAHTDNLIDQIVYKLYGLTDAEIDLIERPAYDQALADAKAKVVADKTLQADPDAAADAMADIILPAARRIQNQVSFAEERAQLDADLPGWQLFPEEVSTFLLSGEYDLHTRPDGLDFSSAVVSFSKAVERMLYHRLFIPWRDEAGAMASDAHNKFLQEFLRKERELTLGSLAIILQSGKETVLRAYIQQRYPHAPAAFFGPDGVAARLNDSASVDLRNAAAHDELLGRDAARSARSWAISILRYL